MAGNDTSAKGRRAIRFCCATPVEKCNGTKCGKQHGRTHTNQAEALACQRNYLLGQGYKQLSTKDFQGPPERVVDEKQFSQIFTALKETLNTEVEVGQNLLPYQLEKLLTTDRDGKRLYKVDIEALPLVPGRVLVLNKKAPRAKAGKSATTYMSQPLKIRPSLPLPK